MFHFQTVWFSLQRLREFKILSEHTAYITSYPVPFDFPLRHLRYRCCAEHVGGQCFYLPSLQGGNIFRDICSGSLISAECKTSLMKSWFWSPVVSKPGRRARRGNMAAQQAPSLIGRCGQHGFTRRENFSSHLVRVTFPQWEAQLCVVFMWGQLQRNLSVGSDPECCKFPRAWQRGGASPLPLEV